MEAPDKIYVREYPDGIAHFWEEKTIPHEYIRKDALLEWANDVKQGLMVEVEKYGVPNEQRVFAFQEFIDKLNSL